MHHICVAVIWIGLRGTNDRGKCGNCFSNCCWSVFAHGRIPCLL